MSILNQKKISHNEIKQYDSLNTYKLINENDRAFMVLTINGTNFIIGWPSDLLVPEILNIEEFNFIAIGIDQKLIIIDSYNNQIYLVVSLSNLFCNFYMLNSQIIVATELELLIFDFHKRELKFEPLPDTFIELKFEGNYIFVEMSNGEFLKLDIAQNF